MGQKTDVIIDAISPTPSSVSARNLHYDNLREALAKFGFISALKKSGEVLQGRRKIPTLETIQHDFYVAYLLNASYRLQRSHTAIERFFWTQQFSVSSVQLFGQPGRRAVASLAAEELTFFEHITTSLGGQTTEFAEPLLAAYRHLVKGHRVSEGAEQQFREVLGAVHDYFYERYGGVLSVFDVYEDTAVLHPEELRESFSRALELLKRRDPAWKKWQVVMVNTGNLSASPRNRCICIGRYRVPVPVREVRGLFAHEVLVHALRSVNGEKRSRDMRRGLGDYLTAEEGMGVLVESAINGSVAYKVKDRYLDIALAIGSYRRRALTREELFVVAYSRAVLRSLVDDNPADLDDIEKAAWQHVNRIYRGTLGNKYVGVFTKDIAYYEGFVKMARYIDIRLKAQPVAKVVEYILQGKFDPTNAKHNRVLKKRRQS
jgi:hypothetical protein